MEGEVIPFQVKVEKEDSRPVKHHSIVGKKGI